MDLVKDPHKAFRYVLHWTEYLKDSSPPVLTKVVEQEAASIFDANLCLINLMDFIGQELIYLLNSISLQK